MYHVTLMQLINITFIPVSDYRYNCRYFHLKLSQFEIRLYLPLTE